MKFKYIIPNIFTMLAFVLGFFAILHLFTGHDNYVLVGKLIILAMILDGLDGPIARRLHSTSDFGAEFDTFVDFLCFGVAPSLLIFDASLSSLGKYGVLTTGALMLAGALRLSRFKAYDPLHGQGGYIGMPITVGAGGISLICIINSSKILNLSFVLSIFIWVITFLMVSPFHYPKPTKNKYVMSFMIAMVILLMFDFSKIISVGLIIIGSVYMLFGPLFKDTWLFSGENLSIEEDEKEHNPMVGK